MLVLTSFWMVMVLHVVMLLLHGHELCLLAGLHSLDGRQGGHLTPVTVGVGVDPLVVGTPHPPWALPGPGGGRA